jgi:hypothetical protein
MTEHRPFYHSGTTEPTPSLVQHYADGTTASDALLLLPILQSPLHAGTTDCCLHLVHLQSGKLLQYRGGARLSLLWLSCVQRALL